MKTKTAKKVTPEFLPHLNKDERRAADIAAGYRLVPSVGSTVQTETGRVGVITSMPQTRFGTLVCLDGDHTVAYSFASVKVVR